MKNIIEHILEAREEAIKKCIEANTIIINENVAICNGLYLKDFDTIKYISPHILGLKIEYVNQSLPLDANFMIGHTEEPEDKNKKAIQIIKKKMVDVVYLMNSCHELEHYNEYCPFEIEEEDKLTEEEFNLLKEVLSDGLE